MYMYSMYHIFYMYVQYIHKVMYTNRILKCFIKFTLSDYSCLRVEGYNR